VGAAREQRRQNHQIPWCEQPLSGPISKALGGACNEAQAMALREIVEMLGANSREVRDLCVSENLLASFDGYHGVNSHNLSSDLNFKSLRLEGDIDFVSPHSVKNRYFTSLHTSASCLHHQQ
jgi:hypothetical protein